MRSIVVCEKLADPLDEGIRILAASLLRELRRFGPALGISTTGTVDGLEVVQVRGGRLFTSPDILLAVRRFRPDLVLYVSWTSCSVGSLIRSVFLRMAAGRARFALVSTQHTAYGPLWQPALRLFAPRDILALTPQTVEQFSRMGRRVRRFEPGVDLEAFRPASAEEKARLRSCFGVPADAYVVAHAGHINPRRNLRVLADIQRSVEGVCCVMSASGSTPVDDRTYRELIGAGVLVIRDFIERMEQFYQMADCYVFPVRLATSSGQESAAAIGLPLSVLEALACGLPVAITPFGSLPDALPATRGVEFVHDDSDFPDAIRRLRDGGPYDVRPLAERFAWPRVVERMLQSIGVLEEME